MTPRFSVVIPAFNAAATLARAIVSVREQSWPAHEIIVVDDGSSDDTAMVAGSFGEVVKLIRRPCGVEGAFLPREAPAAECRSDLVGSKNSNALETRWLPGNDELKTEL